jgi:hypothetical protein
MSRPLTDRQERFVHEYLLDQNASAAAERAGYSPKTKGTQAADLMKIPAVRERVVIELNALYARLKVNAYDLLRTQVAAVYFDPAKLFSGDDAVPLEELDADTKSALTVNYEKRRGETVMKVRQTPRHVALAALWRRYDQFQKLQAEVLGSAEPEPAAAPPPAPPAPHVPHVPPVLDIDLPHVAGRRRAPDAPQTATASAPAEATPQTPPETPPMPPQAATPGPAMAQSEADAGADAASAPPAADTPQEALARADAALAQVQLPEPRAKPKATPETAQRDALHCAVQRDGTVMLSKRKKAAPPKPAVPETPETAPAPVAPACEPGPGAPPPTRRDPDLLWGGKRPPTPEPEPNPLIEQHIANVRAAEQRAELFGKFANPNQRIRPGQPLRPPGVDPGYNPPWLRDNRRQYAIGAGECSFDGYGEDS